MSYSPLPTNGHFTRVLHLLPGATTDPLVCELSLVDLDNFQDEYAAVSYTWGNDSPLYDILLNGRVFKVRENLHMLLHELRLVDQTLTLWIDAICIDQGSFEERNQQVGLMGKIFSGAAHVQAWLGRASDEDCLAFEAVSKLATIQSSTLQPLPDDFVRRCLDSVSVIAGNPYWRRVWIVQELVLARDITIRCGGLRCSWDELLSIISVAPKASAVTIRAIANSKTDRDLSFVALFSRFGALDCSIDHDRFYSLYGLVRPASLPTPDYSLCMTRVVIQQLSSLQDQFVLDHLPGLDFVEASSEAYPLSFVRRILETSPKLKNFTSSCSCHTADIMVKLRLSFRGHVRQTSNEPFSSRTHYCINRQHDIYRFRRFTAESVNGDLIEGDLAFELSPIRMLVVRDIKGSSDGQMQPVAIVKYSSIFDDKPDNLSPFFDRASLQYKGQALDISVPISDLGEMALSFGDSE